MTPLRTAKTLSLGLMIALGLFAQAKTSHAQQLETLTVAGGCFWCVEADFEKVQGVKEAVSGFAGGTADAFTLFELFEAQLQKYQGQLIRAAVELAKAWRTERALRRQLEWRARRLFLCQIQLRLHVLSD